MPKPPSLEEFRSTLRFIQDPTTDRNEVVLGYWNNDITTEGELPREELLHIVRACDGSYYLEIANVLHTGSLPELERILFDWAASEGFFD